MGYLTPYSNLTDLIGITDLQANLFTSMPVAKTDLMYQTVSGTNMINQRMYKIMLYYLAHYVGLLWFSAMHSLHNVR